jgi:hypothetical protein
MQPVLMLRAELFSLHCRNAEEFSSAHGGRTGISQMKKNRVRNMSELEIEYSH